MEHSLHVAASLAGSLFSGECCYSITTKNKVAIGVLIATLYLVKEIPFYLSYAKCF